MTTLPQDVIFLGSYPPGVSRNTPQMAMPLGAGPLASWLNLCAQGARSAGNRTPQTARLGRSWAMGLVGWTLGNTLTPPNPKTPNCSVNSAGSNVIENPGAIGLSSFHPGGANVLMCDGSVKLLKDTTAPAVVWALGSRAQGEVLSADAY